MKQRLTREEWDAYRAANPQRAAQLVVYYSLIVEDRNKVPTHREARRAALDGFHEWFTIGRMIEFLEAWGETADEIDQDFPCVILGEDVAIGWRGAGDLCDALWRDVQALLAKQ